MESLDMGNNKKWSLDDLKTWLKRNMDSGQDNIGISIKVMIRLVERVQELEGYEKYYKSKVRHSVLRKLTPEDIKLRIERSEKAFIELRKFFEHNPNVLDGLLLDEDIEDY